jgi:poly-gamma-glutamate synthase PgsB/CapB
VQRFSLVFQESAVFATLILVVIAAATSIGFVAEAWLYRRRLKRIPIRIHVNGTRGKSSVARLIAAGLRAGGVRTCCKTTGTLARMIFSDGKEVPIFRPSRANVIEQKRVIRAANADRAEALVIECMALQPMLQSVCELKLVQSTHGVITNARADHLDVMGPTRLDVAAALAGTTPVAGTLFTAEHRQDSLRIMRDAATDRDSEMQSIDAQDTDAITPEMLAGFSYLEHPENIALALRVCESLGVNRQTALQGMWTATPDPGAMRVFRHEVDDQPWYFVNGFAANDPESTGRIWEAAFDRFPEVTRRVAVMNCRVDRPDRSITMADACATWRPADSYIITGTGTDIFLRRLLAAGVPSEDIICVGDADPAEIMDAIAKRPIEGTMILGMGNIAGPGMRLADFFEAAQPWTPADAVPRGDQLPANHLLAGSQVELVEVV